MRCVTLHTLRFTLHTPTQKRSSSYLIPESHGLKGFWNFLLDKQGLDGVHKHPVVTHRATSTIPTWSALRRKGACLPWRCRWTAKIKWLLSTRMRRWNPRAPNPLNWTEVHGTASRWLELSCFASPVRYEDSDCCWVFKGTFKEACARRSSFDFKMLHVGTKIRT